MANKRTNPHGANPLATLSITRHLAETAVRRHADAVRTVLTVQHGTKNFFTEELISVMDGFMDVRVEAEIALLIDLTNADSRDRWVRALTDRNNPVGAMARNAPDELRVLILATFGGT